MRTKICARGAGFASLILILAVLPATVSGSVQVPNAGFEIDDGTGKPQGWLAQQHDPNTIFARDATVSHSGVASARISHPGTDSVAEEWLSSEVPVVPAPGDYVEYSIWYRTNAGGAVLLRLGQRDQAGSMASGNFFNCMITSQGASQWQEVKCRDPLLSTSRTVELNILYFPPFVDGTAPGTVWIDDVTISQGSLSQLTGTPPQPLQEDAITRFEARYAGVTSHFDLYVPKGYNANPNKKYPVLFICSPSGNAVMGNVEAWVKSRQWLAVMLVEAKNGPWEPIKANFYAAHDDVISRARVNTHRKYITGFSGGARMAGWAAIDASRTGFHGLFLQGAGVGSQIPDDRYVFASFGSGDMNLDELSPMLAIAPGHFNHEVFPGGHEPAPVSTATTALAWLESRVEENVIVKTLTASTKSCGAGKVTSTPAAIDCGSYCSEQYLANTVVTLSAVASAGSTFRGWSGDCTGTGPCVVTMASDHSVAAEFVLNSDQDCDDLDDAAETNTGVYVSRSNTGTSPQKFDSDGDGKGDGLEVARGTDPNDPLEAPPAVGNDFDGDGRSDISCYYPPGGNWYGFNSGNGFWQRQFGYAGTIPITGDFDGDGKSDIGAYHPDTGNWNIHQSRDGFRQTQFGYAGTIPVVGDFDGDGRDDIGCYYPQGGNWYVFGSTVGFWQTQFGYAGTIPVVGDFDGDGQDDIGCYYPPGGNWYVFQSKNGFWQTTFGYEGTIPVVGDFDGDGKSDIGCYYPPGGNWYVFKSGLGFWQTAFGYIGTEPVVGDFDGDGKSDLGCYYPAGGKWYVFKSTEGFWQTQFGYEGTIPLGGTLR